MTSEKDTSIKEYWLTTKDNPWNPFSQYEQWYQYDTVHGYNISGLIARFANTSLDMSDEEYKVEVNKAINRIIELGLLSDVVRVENTINN